LGSSDIYTELNLTPLQIDCLTVTFGGLKYLLGKYFYMCS